MTILPSHEKQQSQDFADKIANLVFNSGVKFPEVPEFRIINILQGITKDFENCTYLHRQDLDY